MKTLLGYSYYNCLGAQDFPERRMTITENCAELCKSNLFLFGKHSRIYAVSSFSVAFQQTFDRTTPVSILTGVLHEVRQDQRHLAAGRQIVGRPGAVRDHQTRIAAG